MSLKLIKEAQIRSTLPQEQIRTLENAASALGKHSIHELFEAFQPTPEDYTTWLDVILGYAAEQGMKINTRRSFNEIAHAVLENDPMSPPFDMREHIVNKLWQDHKANKHHARVEQVVQAQEEEEALDAAISALANNAEQDGESETELDVSVSPDEDVTIAWVDDNHKCSNCGAHICDDEKDLDDETNRVAGAEELGDLAGHVQNSEGLPDNFPYGEENEEQRKLPAYPTRPFNRDEWNAQAAAARIIKAKQAEMKQKKTSHEENEELGGDNPVSSAMTPFHQGFLDGYKSRPVRDKNNAEYVRGHDRGCQECEKHRHEMEDEEKTNDKSSLLQQVLTGPKDELRKATKDVESDGENAWKAHQLPTNPHPVKSLAHKAWDRGLQRAIKSHLGIDDKSSMSTSSKPRKK